ncbi:regulator [Streptomyces sp. NPDC012510]|uniref:regulator n=1 Tax=Streptomyces sp. NPDC012510 TaxID=3364838 RepID=UPI0036E04484
MDEDRITALTALLRALREGAGGEPGRTAMRELPGGLGDMVEATAPADVARAVLDPGARGRLRTWAEELARSLAADPELAERVAEAMDRHVPGSGTVWYAHDHVDFSGMFLREVVGVQVNVGAKAPPTAHDSLPPRTTGFAGRTRELEQLREALDPSRAGELPVLVTAVSGLGGIGKTALAVVAGHAARDRGWYPGGLFFVDLRGYDEVPGTPESALESLLVALGVPQEHIPERGDDRAALYRTTLAEREGTHGPALILADNASSADQVRPLLPGGSGHRVLVTARSRLPQLDARLLRLDELTGADAHDLLDRALRIADPSDTRITDDRARAADLAGLCGHLPLALRIVAALLAGDPELSVDDLVAQLDTSRQRLKLLEDGERSVLASFDLSYRRLPDDQARALRLLALAPTARSATAAVAALLDDTAPSAVLSALLRAHLVERAGPERWRLHDLVREYAATVAADQPDLRAEGDAARVRVLRFYCTRTAAATDWLWDVVPSPREGFEDRDSALAWLVMEQENLVAALEWTGHDGCGHLAAALADQLWHYLDWRRESGPQAPERKPEDGTTAAHSYRPGWVNEAIGTRVQAIAAHRASGDCVREAVAWNALGFLFGEALRVEEAISAHSTAVFLFQTAGDWNGAGAAWNNLGTTLSRSGRARGAVQAHARARDIFQQVTGDLGKEGWAWTNLAEPLGRLGREQEEAEASEIALDLCERSGMLLMTAHILRNLASQHRTVDDPATARAYWTRSAEAYVRAGAPHEAACARAMARAP